ncbi:MAG TPA: GNAT family N-acetyltransferase [Rhizomicrobium sp.]|jgi:phosphinothricin acetyltransferase
MSDTGIRRATDGDLPALLHIYNHYVATTPITFDVEPRTLDQRRDWFTQFAAGGRHQCFVAVADGEAIGWSSSGRFKERAAYDTSVEASVYLAPAHHGKGLGHRLYSTLFAALATEDVHRVYGGITLPNAASIGLHKVFGFKHIGTQHEVGRKFGKFWDVALYERAL